MQADARDIKHIHYLTSKRSSFEFVALFDQDFSEYISQPYGFGTEFI